MNIPIVSGKAGLPPKLGSPVPEKSGMAGREVLLEQSCGSHDRPTITGMLISEDREFYTIRDGFQVQLTLSKSKWRIVGLIKDEVF
ncbi:MAG: hypothetical protein JRN26_01280 [Nitrososphaerota archaeon]|jgi:hypothetical protein|nr:hypothetical protein [Nitrososphaerota archaeon]MDG6932703.1 hypothetical protein [Nitrososphaerota archaeon]MDG6935511.1 hypothetical protein [Nitrososphaerota archaeon]MDG6943406.1 hypothetical protein [Nitrososphaerota archaeon]